MAIKYSQGYVEAMLEKQSLAEVFGTDIALVDGGTGSDTITRTAADFLTAGFAPGDDIFVRNATDSDDDIDGVTCSDVVAGTITLPTGTWTTGEAAGATIFICAARGGGVKELLNGGKVTVFSGTRPSSASDAPTGATALIEFDDLIFADASWDGTNNYAYIDLSASITAAAIATGVGTWFRCTGKNENRDGASTTAIRFDGLVGTSGDMQVSTTSYTLGVNATLDQMKIKCSTG
jgi:hypothetical protein